MPMWILPVMFRSLTAEDRRKRECLTTGSESVSARGGAVIANDRARTCTQGTAVAMRLPIPSLWRPECSSAAQTTRTSAMGREPSLAMSGPGGSGIDTRAESRRRRSRAGAADRPAQGSGRLVIPDATRRLIGPAADADVDPARHAHDLRWKVDAILAGG
jgi:hypothetical protein